MNRKVKRAQRKSKPLTMPREEAIQKFADSPFNLIAGGGFYPPDYKTPAPTDLGEYILNHPWLSGFPEREREEIFDEALDENYRRRDAEHVAKCDNESCRNEACMVKRFGQEYVDADRRDSEERWHEYCIANGKDPETYGRFPGERKTT